MLRDVEFQLVRKPRRSGFASISTLFWRFEFRMFNTARWLPTASRFFKMSASQVGL